MTQDKLQYGLALTISMGLTILLTLAACRLLYMTGYARDEGFYAPSYFEGGNWLLLPFGVLIFCLELVACLWMNPKWKWVVYPLIILYFIFGMSICIGLPVFWNYVVFL